MVKLEDIADLGLLQAPPKTDPKEENPVLERAPSNYKSLDTFALPKVRQYQQQFADIYFLRLTKIKPAVEKIAHEAWEETVLGGEQAKKVERVLDVRQGELCWVAGTVYMDMPLKPSILEDVSKDRWISAPTSVDHYYSEDDRDQVMLEDDSGRIRLVGEPLKNYFLVTGCIIAVMGTENANGEFEVIDLKFADLPPQPPRWSLSDNKKAISEDVSMIDANAPSKKIAIVSGLEFSGSSTAYSAQLKVLKEFLACEALDLSHQSNEISKISRLIVAGNSIAEPISSDPHSNNPSSKTHTKKYGYDASSYNPVPSQLLDSFLNELLPTLPVTILPGVNDPSNVSYPQQPIHSAMFPRSRLYGPSPTHPDEPGWLDATTNPFESEIEGWRVLGTSGQNLDDICKYMENPDRLGLMEAMCRWRCSAPTAPDTLWSYPFQDDEPFVMKECPHLYFVGSQPEFGTKVIEGPDGQMVRLILVPKFSATKEVVLVDTETLEVSRVRIGAKS
ncbi:DNA polymerase alpha/epsilon subunit B-domain-containing protein [Triangularia verruculosa]|uniref:DNA-directed DNA polymerase n=1 Tax=Triangularia verruculosa TaxID=2587418 RepID=A0AAN6XMW3_9PEZI|nr:DNA polymerase alpha/epsilon subunit B-domain-containing protein [Triangularia verruculosa]